VWRVGAENARLGGLSKVLISYPSLVIALVKILFSENLYPFVLLAPHTNRVRDVPRCGALTLLQKPLHYMGIQQISLLG
jgi:hypothetical protein